MLRLTAHISETVFVSLHFDNEYEMYLSKGSLVSLARIVEESINSIENFDRLRAHEKSTEGSKGNVLQFKKKDDPST